MIKLLLVEDHRMVREGFRVLLSAETDLEVVGEATDGLEAIKMADQLAPDVVIMDLIMPNLNGLEAARQISHKAHAPKVLILSMHTDESYVASALRNGADAYVLKDGGAQEMIKAIRTVMSGQRYLSPPLSEGSIAEFQRKMTDTELPNRYETLTNREREVLQLCAEGNTNMEIGSKLFISHRTVETHRANLMQKLNLRNHAELVRFAVNQGILPISPMFQASPSQTIHPPQG